MRISYFKCFLITIIFLIWIILVNEFNIYAYGLPLIALSYLIVCLFVIDYKIFNYSLLKFKNIWLIIISVIGFYIINLIISFIPYFITSYEIAQYEHVTYSVKDIFILIFIVPIAEELFFRGFLAHGISLVYNNKSAILLSALVFGLLHYYSGGILIAFLGGIYFGYIYIKTKNIYLSIIAHTLINMMVLYNEESVKYFISKIDITSNTYAVLGFLFLGLIICFLSLKKMGKST